MTVDVVAPDARQHPGYRVEPTGTEIEFRVVPNTLFRCILRRQLGTDELRQRLGVLAHVHAQIPKYLEDLLKFNIGIRYMFY